MNAEELETKIVKTEAAIARLDDRINWILRKIDYRKRRLRELGKKRTEVLNFLLDLR